jgi:acetyl/propionyl-CoA carboxylase alpha subunit
VFDTVLIADRGDTALLVVRTCQRMGIKAVSVHADADAKDPHATEADESVLLGDLASYADEGAVLEAARQTGAQAVHPGAGPLGYSDSFAQAVEDAGLVWIGSGPDVLGPEEVERQLRAAAEEHDAATRGTA